MKKLLPAGLSVSLLFASCGTTSIPASYIEISTPTSGDSEAAPNPAAPSQQIPKATYSSEEVAQQFIIAGVSSDRLEQIKQDLLITKGYIQRNKNGTLSAQSVDNAGDEMDVLIEGLDIAKSNNGTGALSQQAYSRSLLIQATYNIALNSLSNFEYHAQAATYFPALTYVNDGCSTYGMFPAGAALFLRACNQQDFGYRNGAFWRETHTPAFKGSVDGVLNTNNLQLCRERWGSSGSNLQNCYDEAGAFFVAVKAVPVCPPGMNAPFCWASNYKDGDPIYTYLDRHSLS